MKPETKPKHSTGFRVGDATLEQIRERLPKEGSRSLQQFCERAVQFYISYLISEEKNSFLSESIRSTLQESLGDYEDKVKRDHNRLAIVVTELAMVLLMCTNLSLEELRRIRGYAVRHVRENNGPTALTTAQKLVDEMLYTREE